MSGIERIAAERQRQIDDEGWTAEHDDAHIHFELTDAAGCYAEQATWLGCHFRYGITPELWPELWAPEWWKPSPRGDGRFGESSPIIKPQDSIRMLEKAGALIAAEIDRLERADPTP